MDIGRNLLHAHQHKDYAKAVGTFRLLTTDHWWLWCEERDLYLEAYMWAGSIWWCHVFSNWPEDEWK